MVRVEEAEKIILSQVKNFGTEQIPFEAANERVLASPIKADRDFPPFNRVTMDGICISFDAYKNGTRVFKMTKTQAAGDNTTELNDPDECIEIMTGAALPGSADTVIPYEHLNLSADKATIINDTVTKGQNIHYRGKDKKQDDILVPSNYVMDAAAISIAASVGIKQLVVRKLPEVVILSTGDELVPVEVIPLPAQIRQSNSYAIKAALETFSIHADVIHIPDEKAATKKVLESCLNNYDVIIITGGISMGRFDYVPEALENSGVKKLFHKVQQRPGKPFWFGSYNNNVVVFAFPGNPVSTFMCLVRYFIPWLKASLNIETQNNLFAALEKDVSFNFPLQYFMQVQISLNNKGQLVAMPVEGNGSGDFVNLLTANAFMELPMEENNFTKGSLYRVWPFKAVI